MTVESLHRKVWSLSVRANARAPITLGEIHAVDTDCCADTQSLENLLSADERQRAQRFHFERDRRRYVAAHAALRQLLATRLEVKVSQLEFVVGDYGKPRLAATLSASGLHFNLSHSSALALIALCHHCELGVDVEAIRSVNDEAGLADSCFSPMERREYHSTAATARRDAFFSGWTRKEAIIKALGKGLSQPLDSFDVSLSPDQPARIHRFESVAGADCGLCRASFTPAPDYVAAVAVRAYECHVI
jgi:4'-phosphopantetheinyl transferase